MQLILLAFIGLGLAAPSPDTDPNADPQLMVYPYSYYYHPYRFIGKRSADAETKASPDADPQGVPPGLLLAPVPIIRRLFGKRSA